MLAAKNTPTREAKMSNLLRSKGLLPFFLSCLSGIQRLWCCRSRESGHTGRCYSRCARSCSKWRNLSSPNAVLLNLLVSKGILTTSEAAES